MADISQIKLPNNTTYDLKDAKKTGIYPVIGTQTAATGTWTGALHGVSALYNGLTIMYYLPWNGSGNATLNLTLDNGTTTGAVNCYYSAGRLTTHYGKGCNIVMTYWSAGSIKVDGTATTDNRWIANANYTDGNSVAYYISNYYNYFVAGSNKIFPYTIVMQNADGRWESLVTSSSTGTSKARNTHGFRLGQMAYLNANATYAENAQVGNNQISYHKSDLIDHRYSFNTANNSTSGTTAKKPIYLVGAINASDGLFYLDATWWTQTLPSTADGKLYIYLGDAYDYYRMSFVMVHPVYWYRNGMIREFAQDAATVTGHTVAKDVPSNAVFTDHTYSGTGLISVNASTGVISTTATANTGTITSVKTTAGAHTAINVTSGAANFNVPTKTSHLTNDSGFVTSDTKVRQTLSTTNKNYPLLMSYAESSNTTANIDNVSYRANAIYANPSTGNIQATKLNGVNIGSSPKFTDTTYTGTGAISVNASTHVISTTAEANQNAFSNIKVGSTTVAADTKTDTIEFVAGSNVTLTPDAANDKITIAVSNTDTKVSQVLDSSNQNRPLIMAGTTISDTNSSVNSTVARNNNIYANPYTGDIYAGASNGITNDNKLITGADFIGSFIDDTTSTGYSYGIINAVDLDGNNKLKRTQNGGDLYWSYGYNPAWENLTARQFNGIAMGGLTIFGSKALKRVGFKIPKTVSPDLAVTGLLILRNHIFMITFSVNLKNNKATATSQRIAGNDWQILSSTYDNVIHPLLGENWSVSYDFVDNNRNAVNIWSQAKYIITNYTGLNINRHLYFYAVNSSDEVAWEYEKFQSTTE